jgi:hypothetical protein
LAVATRTVEDSSTGAGWAAARDGSGAWPPAGGGGVSRGGRGRRRGGSRLLLHRLDLDAGVVLHEGEDIADLGRAGRGGQLHPPAQVAGLRVHLGQRRQAVAVDGDLLQRAQVRQVAQDQQRVHRGPEHVPGRLEPQAVSPRYPRFGGGRLRRRGGGGRSAPRPFQRAADLLGFLRPRRAVAGGGHQRLQRIGRTEQQAGQFAVDAPLAVAQLFHQALEGVGEANDAVQPEHPAAALDRVDGAKHRVHLLPVGRRGLQLQQRRFHGGDVLGGFLKEDVLETTQVLFHVGVSGQQLGYDLNESHGAEGLDNPARGAGHLTLADLGFVVFGGEHQQRRVLGIRPGPRPADELQSIHHRHVQIGDNQIHSAGLLELGDAFFSVGGLDHFEAHPAKSERHHLSHGDRVVDD